ncbi:hypothetical protein [Flavobacterium sp.]|uniref:hypothetical protein n=1 Tax=Flavobacterium sp. TaxID=239 RepID=UPI00261A1D4D|nr:hypothetical protein [Flavobacterium sp.]MDD3005613.1 hypothetical protein [Flavobacterium sp.]
MYFLTVLFLVSCHSDVLEEEAAAPFFSKDPSPLLDSPLNPYNPFDYAGQIHNELLTLHYPVFHQTSAVDSIIGMVRFKTQEHNLLKNDTLSPIYV